MFFNPVISLTDTSGSQGVELRAISQVAAECGKNVTVTCDASSVRQLDIRLFSWLARNKTVCLYGADQHGPEVLCESTGETSKHRLTLTLINVMPVNEGKYLCKLRSKLGVSDAATFLTVHGELTLIFLFFFLQFFLTVIFHLPKGSYIFTDCLEESGFFTNESHADCWFSGVYPSGTVHWFQGGVNLTDLASTHEVGDQHGRYDILSEIDVEIGNPDLPYNCSLWIPSGGKYVSGQQVTIYRNTRSSGSMVQLQGICIMMAIMMVKLMT